MRFPDYCPDCTPNKTTNGLSMRVHYLQHVPFEGPSMVFEWAKSNGYSIDGTEFYKNDYKLPATRDFDMLVVVGGPMSVNDDALYPWLVEERAYIKKAIDSGKYVLGICLGAQQIAKALGAEVKPSRCKEIGWYPIALTDQALGLSLFNGLNTAMTVFHWHSETFDIPDGAIALARSRLCANQGFLYQSKVLALQFHIEMDAEAIQKLVEECSAELLSEEGIQEKHMIIREAEHYHSRRTLFQLLNNWISHRK